MAPKNTLSIRLAEPVVFLRGSAETTVTGRRPTRPVDPAVLRGLLVLQIDKPMKISSIEVALEGKSQISWPEGVGTRKLDVTEEHEIFSVTSTYFKAGRDSAFSARRTASIGPGLVCDHEDIEDDSTSNEDSHRAHRRRDSANFSWLHGSRRRISIDHSSNDRPRTSLDDIPTPPYSPPSTRPASFIRQDSNHLPSTAATSPFIQRENSSTSLMHGSGNASLRSRISDHDSEQHGIPGSPLRPHLSREASDLQSSQSSLVDTSASQFNPVVAESSTAGGRSRSRGRPRVTATFNSVSASSSRAPSLSAGPPSPMPFIRPATHNQHSLDSSANNSNSVLSAHPYMAESEVRTPSSSPHRERGRRHMRFSLMSVSNALLDAVKERVRSRSRSKDHHQSPAASRDHSPEPFRRTSGRRTDGSPGGERGRPDQCVDESSAKEKHKERTALGRIGDALGLDIETGEGEHDGWKEFRKGIYTYPISIVIPGDAPPSLQCDFGSVTYTLKATVHRPGAFTHRISASREVTLIASPGEDDVEESDNIVVQREWDSQMHYIIIISGRTFPIGSAIPVHITFMPIAKIKIYRISAIIEEKIEYLSQGKRVTRAEPVHKFELLSVRHFTKEPLQVLPLTTDYSESPLKGLIDADDESDAASSLMSPGPWEITANLELPKSCARMHFTNKHKRSNISITHTLKIVFRVERGDDEYVDAKTGLRKHFDIVVQTPMHILSCHCNNEWTSLPRYSRLGINPLSSMQSCPCVANETRSRELPVPALSGLTPQQTPNLTPHTPAAHVFHPLDLHSELPAVGERQQAEDGYDVGLPASGLVSDAPSDLESLFHRNAQFARLVAGEESEVGDPPPQYETVASHENALGTEATTDVLESH